MAANYVVGNGIWPKINLIQGFIVVLVTCKNEEDPSKTKALEWSQYVSHYKFIGIFPDAQGQLTTQSLVGSCRISNPCEIL